MAREGAALGEAAADGGGAAASAAAFAAAAGPGGRVPRGPAPAPAPAPARAPKPPPVSRRGPWRRCCRARRPSPPRRVGPVAALVGGEKEETESVSVALEMVADGVYGGDGGGVGDGEGRRVDAD